MRTQLISKARRIVVKIGSNVLTGADGHVNEEIIGELARQVACLCRSGKEIILVTSGAVSTGMVRMGLSKRPNALPQLQAAAAVGQSHLMNLYAKQFGSEGIEVAQILLTADDLKVRQRHLNARNTIIALLERKVVPVINENDTVSTEEIKFGDNDALSALVSNLVKADLLVILTDIEGLMTRDPKMGGGELVREVQCMSAEIEALARGVGSTRGTGGMASKLKAVKMVTSSGEAAIIADGRRKDTLDRLFAGEELGTLFHPGSGKLRGRKRWIAFFIKPKGKIVVDDGAASALLDRGKSLLPTGVKDVVGDFKGGDKVSIVTLAGVEIARGLTNYPAEDLRRIKGLKTGAIHEILGHKDYDEVVHRDNLVLIAESTGETADKAE